MAKVSSKKKTQFWGTGRRKKAVARVKQLNFFDVLQQYPENIVENVPVVQPAKKQEPDVDMDKNVLISLVKPDNVERYLDQSAKIYYTGKRFPSTVALNKLSCFRHWDTQDFRWLRR